jgi:hypothetical protein
MHAIHFLLLHIFSLSNQVFESMGSRNGNVVRGTLQKLGFNTTGTRLFPRSRNEERGQVPSSRLLSSFHHKFVCMQLVIDFYAVYRIA